MCFDNTAEISAASHKPKIIKSCAKKNVHESLQTGKNRGDKIKFL